MCSRCETLAEIIFSFLVDQRCPFWAPLVFLLNCTSITHKQNTLTVITHLYNPAKPDFILEPVRYDFVPDQPYIRYTCELSDEDPEAYCLSVYHSDTGLEVREEYHKDDIAGFESANAFGDLRSALPDNDIYGDLPCIPRPVRYHLVDCKPGMVVYELLPSKDETSKD